MELKCDASDPSPCKDPTIGQQFFLELNFAFKQVPASWPTSM